MDIVDQLKNLLLGKRLTIAVAESLTVGHLQTLIATPSGSSDYFLGGITAYNLDQKVKWLNVDREHAAKVNCVSPQVASEMARNIRLSFSSDIGLSTTGYAEPSVKDRVEQPFAYFAISTQDSVNSGLIEAQNLTRNEVQSFVASQALKQLIELLTNNEVK